MKKTLQHLVVLTALAHASAFAAAPPPVPTNQPNSGFIPVEQAQRALPFDNRRHRFLDDGRIFICPIQYKMDSDYRCYGEGDNNPNGRWVDLENFQIPGYERAGMAFYYAGSGYRHLIVYFRKKP